MWGACGRQTRRTSGAAAIAEVGLDPTMGHLHVCQPGRDSFVYDLMERHRPEVDRDVLDFVRSHTFTPRDFVMDDKGVCRLHPDLARVAASIMMRSVSVSSGLTSLLSLERSVPCAGYDLSEDAAAQAAAKAR